MQSPPQFETDYLWKGAVALKETLFDGSMRESGAKLSRLLLSWRLIIILYFALFVPLFRPLISIGDPVGYYSWARSVLIDGDMDVTNEFAHYGMDGPATPAGYMHNQWPAGSSWIWLPAMGVAHLVVLFGTALGATIPADGYSWPYIWAASLTSTFVGLGALLLCYSLVRQFYSEFVSLVSVITVWLATPLVFYQYHQPLMSHINDAFLNVVFVLVWLYAHKHSDRAIPMLGLGMVIGAAVWVRPQNGILLCVVLLEISYDLFVARKRQGENPDFRSVLARSGWLLVGFGILFVPLLAFWQRIYGTWVINTYHASGGGEFDWRARHMLDVLISTDRGLFVWTPVTVLCAIGILRLGTIERRLTIVLGGIALLQWYVIGSWSAWSGGDAFGPRFWIALTPLGGISLAAFVNYFDRTTPRRRLILVGVMTLFIGWNFLLMLQYSLGAIAPSGPVDLGTMIENQFTVAPQLFVQLIARIRQWFTLTSS